MTARSALVILLALAGCNLDNSEKNKCAVQEDCLDGKVCNLVTGVCEAPGECTPAVCTDKCGVLPDGCGGGIQCDCTGTGEVCGAGGPNVCAVPPPHCTNGVTDEGESDKDCGGTCGPCAVGAKCNGPADCDASDTCEDNVCLAGSWARVADIPTAREYVAAVYGPDGLIYVLGGIRNGPGGISGAVEAYNPVTNSWTTRAPLLTPRYGFAAVVGSDGKIYTIGGQYNNATSPSTDGNSVLVEAYDPATNMWTAMPPLPNGRYNPAAVAAPDGNIYVTGGFSVQPIEVLASIAKFTPGGSGWTTLSPIMTNARNAHAMVLGDANKLYAVGGYNTGEYNTLEYWVPGSAGWNTAPPMQLGRKHLSASFVDGKIYVIGGNSWVSYGMPYPPFVEVFDTATNTWSQAASMPKGRWAHASVVAPNGKIYVLGGTRDETDNDTKVVEVFTP